MYINLLIRRTSDEFVVPDANELVHGGAGHVLRDDDGAGDTEDLAEAGLPFFISDLGQILLRVWEGTGHDVRDGGDDGQGAEDFGRAETLRQGRLTTVVSFRYPSGDWSLDQTEPVVPKRQEGHGRLKGRLRVD